jgi:hypothetical protein
MVRSCEDCAMHATFIRYAGPDAKVRAGGLRETLDARLVAAPLVPDTADVAAATRQSKTAILMEALAALAIANGGYAG